MRDGKNSNPGPVTKIQDPQHWPEPSKKVRSGSVIQQSTDALRTRDHSPLELCQKRMSEYRVMWLCEYGTSTAESKLEQSIRDPNIHGLDKDRKNCLCIRVKRLAGPAVQKKNTYLLPFSTVYKSSQPSHYSSCKLFCFLSTDPRSNKFCVFWYPY